MTIAAQYDEFAAREAHGVLALDGTLLAWTRPHGQAITWFGPRCWQG